MAATLTLVRCFTADEEEEQICAAWAHLARACQVALNEMHPHHPERAAFVEMWTDCRSAAGIAAGPAIDGGVA